MTYEEIVSFVKKNINKTGAKNIDAHIAVEFDIYGDGEGAFYVEVNNGSIVVEPYEYYDRDAKVIITADELVNIINGERTPQDSTDDGILMVEGDTRLALELMKLVKTKKEKKTKKTEQIKLDIDNIEKKAETKTVEKKDTAKKATKTVKKEKTASAAKAKKANKTK